jgi:hypothetical protein
VKKLPKGERPWREGEMAHHQTNDIS